MEQDFIIGLQDLELSTTEVIVRMAVAAGIGFSIGLEREYSSRDAQGGHHNAGIRTFIFITLLGFFSALLSLTWGVWLFVAGFFGVVVLTGLSYQVSSKQGKTGITTEFTALLAYLIGGTLLLGYIEIALVMAVFILVMLSLKLQIREVMGQVTREELYAVIQFIVVLLLIFPFPPNRTIGPYNVFNPRELGWVIVIISGIGLGGYLLSRILGTRKGILYAGLLGGIVSSTMLTWIYSDKSKKMPVFTHACVTAIATASSLMVIRVFVWVVLFKGELVYKMIIPLAIMTLAGLISAFYYYRKSIRVQDLEHETKLGKPLDWQQSLIFAIFYTGVIFLVSYANNEYGSLGVYVSTAIASLTDVDVIAISVSKLAGKTLSYQTAMNAILLVAISNSVVKWAIALWNGSRQFRKEISWVFGVMVVSGCLGFLILHWMA
jgi:uncharacterized membrane protein (DUF4010 family)